MISLWEKHRRDDRIRPSDSSTIYLLTAKGRIEGCIEMMRTIGEWGGLRPRLLKCERCHSMIQFVRVYNLIEPPIFLMCPSDTGKLIDFEMTYG